MLVYAKGARRGEQVGVELEVVEEVSKSRDWSGGSGRVLRTLRRHGWEGGGGGRRGIGGRGSEGKKRESVEPETRE